MKKPALATLAALAALATFATPLKWVCEWPEARAQSFTLYHGETATFEPSFRVNGSVATNVAVEACYVQTNGMGEAWWTLADATFHPTNDVGAASYRFFVRARAGGDVVYRANGILRMQDSPGFEPAAVPFPRRVLDFDAVEIANAPWPTAADIEEAASAAIETATNAIPGTVSNIVTKSYVEDLGISGGGGTGDDFIVNVSGDAQLPAVDVDNFWYIHNETAGSSVRAYGLWKDWIKEVARASAAGNYYFVSNRATTAVQPLTLTNFVKTATNTLDNAIRQRGYLTSLEPATNYTRYAATSATNYTDSVVSNIASDVGIMWQYVWGETAWIAVTNYMRTISGVTPSLQLWEVRNGVTNLVYSSSEEITNLCHSLIHDCKTNLEHTVETATNDMPSKAWSRYQSASGAENPAPGEITIVSTPQVMFTGGGEWTRYVNTGGSAIWLLKSNGINTFGGGGEGGEGAQGSFFEITDDEGNSVFSIRRTDSYEVDAISSGVYWDGDKNFCVEYNATNNCPTLFAATNLAYSVAEVAGEIDSLGITVSWQKNAAGRWCATIHQDVPRTTLFVHAKVTQEGSVAVVNSAPTRLDGGVMLPNDPKRYTLSKATINGQTVLVLTEVAQ